MRTGALPSGPRTVGRPDLAPGTRARHTSGIMNLETAGQARIDRRRLIQAGTAGAAAAAVWTTPVLLSRDSAFAGVSCAQQAVLDWNVIGVGNTFTSQTYPAVGSYPALTISHPALTAVGTPTSFAGNNQVSGVQTGNVNLPNWRIWMQCNTGGEGYTAVFNFSVPVYNLRFTIFDIDESAGNWQDFVSLSSPAAFTFTQPAGATATGAGTAANPWVGHTNVGGTSDAGNVNVTFAGPVSTFTLTFLSGPNPNNGAAQFVALSNFRFCR